MGIKVIAIAPDDGWAFIKGEDGISLLRPPYIASNQIRVTEKDVEIALGLHGFEECDSSFDSLKEVIGFLKDKYVEAMKNRGVDLPSLDELKDLLKYATDDILLEYLEKAEKELIPEGKFAVASSIALDIMELEKAGQNPQIYRMAVDVVRKCDQKRKEMEEFAVTRTEENQRRSWGGKYPNAWDEYSFDAMINYTNRTRERGQLLAVGR